MYALVTAVTAVTAQEELEACLILLQSESSHVEGGGGVWPCDLVYEVCQAQHSSSQ